MTANPAGRTGLAAALAAFQAEVPAIPKGETANAGTYTYDYAGLDTVTAKVLPLLGKHGLAFTCWPTLSAEGKFILAYRLCHGPSDEHMDGEYPLPDKGRPQDIGSAISYGRRYCLTAVTGVAPGGEDNDGADVPEHVMDKPRRVAYTGAEHERLAQQSPDELANGRGPAHRKRGQLPDDEWTTPPEDQPGSITPPQVRSLQAHLSKFFDKTERDQRLNAAAAIIGRPIKTSSDLSYTEAEKLIKELETLLAKAEGSPEEPRDILIAVMAALAGATT